MINEKVLKFIVGNIYRDSPVLKYIKNPYNGELVVGVYYAQKDDIELAIQSSISAYSSFRYTPSYKRSEILEKVANIISDRKSELASIMTAESGKPITYSNAEVDRAIFTFKYASEEAKRINGEVIPLDLARNSERRYGIVKKFPIGPILAITPFNFPLNLVAHKIAPAIASGNTVVLKPAPQTPVIAIKLTEILIEAGLPEGVVNVVPCENDLAEMMVRDDRFKMLTFTGSAKVGWYLKSIAGKKKVVLELGGNAAAVVDESADIDYAVKKIVLGAYGQAGQSCIKVQRVYVHKNIYDIFVSKLLSETNKIIFGDPIQPDTISGPLIDETAATRVQDWIQEAITNGAKLLTGGKRNQLLIEPTILTDVTPNMKVFSEEIFGPVLTLHKFEEFNQVIEAVNNTRYGLQAGIFSNNYNNVFYAYENLDVGGVVVNDFPTYRVDHMPYGGIKDSGLGREGLKYAIEEMTESKLLILNFI